MRNMMKFYDKKVIYKYRFIWTFYSYWSIEWDLPTSRLSKGAYLLVAGNSLMVSAMQELFPLQFIGIWPEMLHKCNEKFIFSHKIFPKGEEINQNLRNKMWNMKRNGFFKKPVRSERRTNKKFARIIDFRESVPRVHFLISRFTLLSMQMIDEWLDARIVDDRELSREGSEVRAVDGGCIRGRCTPHVQACNGARHGVCDAMLSNTWRVQRDPL